jgi:hypothetical protein
VRNRILPLGILLISSGIQGIDRLGRLDETVSLVHAREVDRMGMLTLTRLSEAGTRNGDDFHVLPPK